MSQEAVRFENARGQQIAGALHRPSGWAEGGPCVIVCHGMLSSKDSPKHTLFAQQFSERGLLALRFDFAGRGDSHGDMQELTVAGEVQDLAAAVALVNSMGVGSVSLVGSSLGGAVAVLHAGKFGHIASLVTLASVSRPAALFRDLLSREQIERWKTTGTHAFEEGSLGYGFYEDALTQDVLAAAARITCPALFIHGSKDEVVPPSSSQDLHDAAAGRKRLIVIDGADHRFSDTTHLKQALDLVLGWIAP
ncbi:MAG: alpha/beta fold hydrolase [Deltaproteobacteria bacterium]|nr:alpha/beta fold hydrolase [Deltaproteobacteria bacterium]